MQWIFKKGAVKKRQHFLTTPKRLCFDIQSSIAPYVSFAKSICFFGLMWASTPTFLLVTIKVEKEKMQHASCQHEQVPDKVKVGCFFPFFIKNNA